MYSFSTVLPYSQKVVPGEVCHIAALVGEIFILQRIYPDYMVVMFVVLLKCLEGKQGRFSHIPDAVSIGYIKSLYPIATLLLCAI